MKINFKAFSLTGQDQQRKENDEDVLSCFMTFSTFLSLFFQLKYLIKISQAAFAARFMLSFQRGDFLHVKRENFKFSLYCIGAASSAADVDLEAGERGKKKAIKCKFRTACLINKRFMSLRQCAHIFITFSPRLSPACTKIIF